MSDTNLNQIHPPELGAVIGVKRVLDSALSNPDLLSNPASICMDALARVRALLGEDTSQISLVNPHLSRVESLNDLEYVLPHELGEFHNSLDKHIKSGSKNSEFTHTGVCLYGPAGNGKSEYAHYLNGLYGDDLDFFQLSISAIRGTDNPVAELESIYKNIASQCESSGRKAIIFIDEFDEMFSTESAQSTFQDTTKSSSSKSAVTTTTKHSSSVTDEKGTMLYNSFKTLLSGSGLSKDIFTITTTNKTKADIPEVLRRDGRLSAIEISNPFSDLKSRNTGLGVSGNYGNKKDIHIPKYQYFFDYLIDIIDIFITVENRFSETKGGKLRILEAVKADLLSARTSNEFDEVKDKELFDRSGNKNDATFIEIQREALKIVLETLGIKVTDEGFKGFAVYSGHPLKRDSHENIPEIACLKTLNRSYIAGLYKTSREGITQRKLKGILARLIFPQL